MQTIYLFIHLLLFVSNSTLGKIELLDMYDKKTKIDFKLPKKASVIYFLSPECPLCESYSLTIAQIEKEYSKAGFQFIVIIPGKDFSKNEVAVFKNKYKLNALSFLFDPNLNFVKQSRASITPEVMVFDKNETKIYQGRIDNWAYELGKKRTIITEHDLKDVLKKISNNNSIKPYQTKAVGCFIN